MKQRHDLPAAVPVTSEQENEPKQLILKRQTTVILLTRLELQKQRKHKSQEQLKTIGIV